MKLGNGVKLNLLADNRLEIISYELVFVFFNKVSFIGNGLTYNKLPISLKFLETNLKLSIILGLSSFPP